MSLSRPFWSDASPRFTAALAELAVDELDRAASGAPSAAARPAPQIIAEALGAPTVLLVPEADRLRTEAASSREPDGESLPFTEPLAGVFRQADPVELAAEHLPLPLAEPGARGGFFVRVGSEEQQFALLGVFPSGALSNEERLFLKTAAHVLQSRLALDRTRHALTESQVRGRAVLETTVDGVITIDARGRIESFNAAAESIFGYTAAEVKGRNVHVLMPEPYHSEHDSYIDAYHKTGRRRIIGIGREVVGRRKDGSTFPMDLAVSEVPLPDGTHIFTGFIRDISERRLLEQEVLRIAESERRRIGQDLHDGLGQMLTGMGLLARGVVRQLEAAGSPQAEGARELVGLLAEADDFARGLARNLVPVELEGGGLTAALERLAVHTERLFGISCSFEAVGTTISEPVLLGSTVASHLFRITQEAVSNAAQHSGASHIAIALARGQDQVRLRIQDDGVGFPDELRPGSTLAADSPAPRRSVSAPVRPNDNRGMGVRIMHFRSHLAGGSLEIRPGAAGGTVVTCTVPLSSDTIPAA